MRRFIPLLFLVSALSGARANGPSVTVFSPEGLSAIDSYFEGLVDEGRLGGAVVLLYKDGGVRYHKAYGYGDIDKAEPMLPDMIFPVGSMTKPLTSVAVLQLVEQGRLGLDDTVDKYIPEFTGVMVSEAPESEITVEPITKPTVRDLLRHTSGMVYGTGKTVADRTYRDSGFATWDRTLGEFVSEIGRKPLASHPNTAWRYSYSHDILGYLVEKVSGMALDRYCEENIFAVLGLEDTGFVVPKDKAGRLPVFYKYTSGNLQPDDPSSIYLSRHPGLSGGGGWMSAYGGLLSTADDFRVIFEMLLRKGQYGNIRILSEESVVEMVSNQIGELGKPGFRYGLGVGVVLSTDDTTVTKRIYWAGAPYNQYFWVDYEQDFIGIMFTNTAPYGHRGMMEEFGRLADEALTGDSVRERLP